MKLYMKYRLTPSLLGEEYATVRRAIAQLAVLSAGSKQRSPLLAQMHLALESIASEPLPEEIAKGLVAHLGHLAKAASDSEVKAALLGAAETIQAAAMGIVEGSPFT